MGGRRRISSRNFNAQFASGPLARTAANLRAIPWDDAKLEAALREVDLVVNATSAGLDPKAPVILPARMMPPELLVLDTVYGAGCAKLRARSRAGGREVERRPRHAAAPGRGGLHLWTGREAPLEIMRRALQTSLA